LRALSPAITSAVSTPYIAPASCTDLAVIAIRRGHHDWLPSAPPDEEAPQYAPTRRVEADTAT